VRVSTAIRLLKLAQNTLGGYVMDLRKLAVVTFTCTIFVQCLFPTALVSKHFSDWSAPVNLGPVINSAANDQHAGISRDNLSLYFASDRAGGNGSSDLWFTRRPSVDAPWPPPQNLGSVINSPAGEFAPAFAAGGHVLFFGSERAGGCGGRDLWVSVRRDKRDDLGWEPPMNLGCVLNSSAFDDGPMFLEDEQKGEVLYFLSERPGGVGGRDVWRASMERDGSFSPPENVTELNSPALDARAGMRRDGLEIFMTSQREGSVPTVSGIPSLDVWTSDRESTWDLWSLPRNLAALNLDSTDAAPAISWDATTLYFNSDRAGGQGGIDLYVSTRHRLRGHAVSATLP
jgi:WD40-like Beta Propeller Repeat